VRMLPLAGTCGVVQSQDPLHALEEFGRDDRLVRARLLDAAPTHDAHVHGIGEQALTPVPLASRTASGSCGT